MTLTLPRWFDLHTHFRQGPAMGSYVQAHLDMGCAGALAMPNTQPPVSRISGAAQSDGWSIESYSEELRIAGAAGFEQLIVPLYLTRQTTAAMIAEGAASGLLRACKYYPPHGTTNAEHGMPMDDLIGGEVLRAMEEHGNVLCIHGEQHALSGPDYIDAQQNAETRFYTERMPRLIAAHPKLRLVCEHITTRTAAEFVAAAVEQPARDVGSGQAADPHAEAGDGVGELVVAGLQQHVVEEQFALHHQAFLVVAVAVVGHAGARVSAVKQRRLAADGETVRVYVPYGTEWYGYLMRRLAERPQNLTFFLRSLISKK